MRKILVVEDDPSIQALLHDFLQDAGYETATASDGIEAISLFQTDTFDIVLLDLMLPKIDGYGVCEFIRKQSTIPIVMITALDSESDQLKGFDLQIDDYVTKPFSIPVLLKKIEAILRRASDDTAAPSYIHHKGLTLDLDAYKAFTADATFDLTPREFEILREFLLTPGKILTRQNLLNRIWKYEFYGDERVVDTHIKNLRKKMGDFDCIETVRGVGYRIDKDDKK